MSSKIDMWELILTHPDFQTQSGGLRYHKHTEMAACLTWNFNGTQLGEAIVYALFPKTPTFKSGDLDLSIKYADAMGGY
jgi:hypothetical protein